MGRASARWIYHSGRWVRSASGTSIERLRIELHFSSQLCTTGGAQHMQDLSALQTKDNIVIKYEKLLSREARIGTIDLKGRSSARLFPSDDEGDSRKTEELNCRLGANHTLHR